MNVENAIKNRRTIRKFTDYKVTKEEIEKLIEAARWAPSWANTQSWEFVVVQDKDKIKEISNLYSENNYKLLYWGSILFFGLAHGINFSFSNSWYLLFIPLLILPQILAGFILNYIRVKYGIKYSIEFHLLINLQILLIH